MKRRIADTPSELISLLKDHQANGYIFRGQSNAKNSLLPYAYRPKILLELARNFPGASVTEQWAYSIAVQNSIKGWAKGHPISNRLFEYTFHLMQYNHSIQKFYKSGKITFINDNDQRLLENFPDDHWIQQGTFEALFDYFLRNVVRLTSLRGSVLKESYYPNETTGYDQSAPQHYSFPTPLLDWTDDPLVAIYFALGIDVDGTRKSEGLFTVASSLPSEYLAVFAYRQRNKPDSFPIQILSGSTKYNPRILAQKGKFISLTSTMEYYLTNGTFPCTESYNSEVLDLVRIVVKRSSENINFLKDYTEEQGICESSLFPDKELMEVGF